MNKTEADRLFQQAQDALGAGRQDDALALCRAIIGQDAEHAQAHYLMAVLLFQQGRAGQAVATLRAALALQLDLPGGYFNLGAMLQASGKAEEAEAAYRQEIALRPDSVRAYNNLAALCKASGRIGEAEAAYRDALAQDGDYADALQNLALLLEDDGRVAEAEALLRRALAAHPESSESANQLGNVLHAKGEMMEAEACYRHAVESDPGNARAFNNLGVLQKGTERWHDAETSFRKALAVEPECAEAWNNLGLLLQQSGRDGEAETCYRRALIEAPRMADARYNFACLLLQQGKYAQGWREFESRLNMRGNAHGWHLPAPRWDGAASLEGKTIVLTAEQGLGDTLQFLRYAPLVAARGASVIVAVQPPLVRLAALCAGVTTAVGFGEVVPASDYQCPLMSLPLVFGTTLDTVPARMPYLVAGAEAVARWRARLGARLGERRVLRIGLVWAGNPRMARHDGRALDRRRSMHADLLRPLLGVPGVQFFSLQVGEEAARQLADERVVDWTADLADFNETAALVGELDLVISVDTAVAHLAGAMGKPVWLLNRFDTCWRWMREREDSPWYPQMRIFRQSAPGDWAGVVARVGQALRAQLGL